MIHTKSLELAEACCMSMAAIARLSTTHQGQRTQRELGLFHFPMGATKGAMMVQSLDVDSASVLLGKVSAGVV